MHVMYVKKKTISIHHYSHYHFTCQLAVLFVSQLLNLKNKYIFNHFLSSDGTATQTFRLQENGM